MSCEDLFHFYADVGNFGQADFCSFEPNLRANLWQGNTVEIFLHLYAEGVPVDDLATASSGLFQALGHRDNAIGVQKVYPGEMNIDDPETGVVKVILDDTVTSTLEGEYDLTVEFTWPGGKRLEWRFGKTLNVMRDQISYP